MSEHRFRLKRGDVEFEVAGDRDFVEAQIARMLALLEGATPAAPAPEAEAPADELPEHLSEKAIPRIAPNFRPKLNITLGDFVALKEANEPKDLLVVTAYFLEKYLQQGTYSRADLGAHLSKLEAWECQDLEAVLEVVLEMGFLDRARDNTFTLTYKGQTYVRDGLVAG